MAKSIIDRPLRLCFVVSYFHPYESGAERQALAQGAEHARRGNIVHVVTHSVPAVPAEEVVQGVHVHRCIRSSKLGPLFSATFTASTVRALIRLRSEYDVIHTHQALWEGVAAGMTKLGGLRGVPTVVQPASSGYYGEAQELRRTRGAGLLRRLILRNDAFAAISAEIELEWRNLGVSASKMKRIASGVDHRTYAPGDCLALPTLPPGPRVMFTGRLHPQKNLDLLIEAWPAVSKATGASLLLVGEGVERDRLTAKVAQLGASDSVHFLGSVKSPADLLKGADLFALPSLAEGMSNSLLEAMATRLPCMASDIGGNRDLLGVGDAGVLVRNSSPDVWAAEMIALLRDEERRERMGKAARRRIEEEFSLERIVDRYVELYRELLSGTFGA